MFQLAAKNIVQFSEEELDKEMYAQHYFCRILQMGTLSWSVFRGKPFTPSLMFAFKARACLKELYWGRLQPYLQTLD
jgi:hypothetical protein